MLASVTSVPPESMMGAPLMPPPLAVPTDTSPALPAAGPAHATIGSATCAPNLASKVSRATRPSERASGVRCAFHLFSCRWSLTRAGLLDCLLFPLISIIAPWHSALSLTTPSDRGHLLSERLEVNIDSDSSALAGPSF